MKFAISLALTLLAAQAAFAGDCSYTVTRKACPGQEDKAVQPYPNAKIDSSNKAIATTPAEVKAADSADACMKIAADQCKIVRKGTLDSKKIFATFDGKPVKGGADLCEGRKDFGQCK